MTRSTKVAGIGIAATALLVFGTASPALALTTGPKSCPSGWTAFTRSDSTGVTEHIQNGVLKTFNNGLTRSVRYFDRGLQNVSSSSITTTLNLFPLSSPTSANYISCWN